MIVSLKEKFDREQGRDLPMFSRSGKSTVSQYLAFARQDPNHDNIRSSMAAEDDFQDFGDIDMTAFISNPVKFDM